MFVHLINICFILRVIYFVIIFGNRAQRIHFGRSNCIILCALCCIVQVQCHRNLTIWIVFFSFHLFVAVCVCLNSICEQEILPSILMFFIYYSHFIFVGCSLSESKHQLHFEVARILQAFQQI